MKKIIGNIYTPDFAFKPGVIFINDNRIEKVDLVDIDTLSEEEKGRFIIPGLIDIHTHGCFGVDYCNCNMDELKVAVEYEKRCGVTSFCIATMTLSVDRLKGIVGRLCSMEIAAVKGIYLEGPFISKEYKGAQDEGFIELPDAGILEKLNEAAGGMIKIVTVAPEQDGAIELIDSKKDSYRFSIAHSGADYDKACDAFEAGVSQVTHLYNGMSEYHHRRPGIVGATFDYDNIMAELICDGNHVHPAVIRNTFRQLGSERIILISDSMQGTGLSDGNYMLGGQAVRVAGNRALLSDGTIAGSVTNLFDCMKYAISVGISPEDAIRAATYNPAKAIGMENEIGSIRPGMQADLVIMDRNYMITDVL